MKTGKLAATVLSVMALAACTKSETIYTDTDVEVGFSPVAETATKAVYGPMGGESNSTYNTGETFGIFAWHRILANGATSATWSDFISGATDTDTPLYIDNGEFGYKGTYWGGTPAYYWPKTGVLAFAGYSPYDPLNGEGALAGAVEYTLLQANGNNEPTLTVSDFKQGTYNWDTDTDALVNETVDFMWFDADDQNAVNFGAQSQAQTGVPVIFRHACSWIDFNLKPEDNDDASGKFQILKVTLKNVYTKGDFDSSKADDTVNGGDVTLGNANPWTDFGYAETGKTDIVLYDDFDGPVDVSNGTFLGTDGVPTSGTGVAELALGDLLVIPQTLDAVNASTEPDNAAEAKFAAEIEILYKQWTVAAGETPNTESVTIAVTGSNATSPDAGSSKAGEWLYGRHYVYNITFGLDEILIDPSLADWVSGGSVVTIPVE